LNIIYLTLKILWKMGIDDLDALHTDLIDVSDVGENSADEGTENTTTGGDAGNGEDGADGVEAGNTKAGQGVEGDGAGGGSDGSDDVSDDGSGKDGNTDGASQSNLSGIELYLSKFDIDGGMITFEDGTQEHFNNLAPEKQQEILEELHSKAATEIEDQYGLVDEEISLINYLRENNLSVEEMVTGLANDIASRLVAEQQVEGMDVSKFDDDTIYTAFLRRSNPEATAEQIQSDLDTAKKMSNFKSIVSNIRKTFEKEQEEFLENKKREERQNLEAEIEKQRKEVVDAVSSMNELDGLLINDGIKNDVLDMILNVDDDGDSLFMTHVFSDPVELFRAAFWYKNGADIIRTREDYWKKEKSAAYKRGVEDAKTGKRTFTASDVQNKNETRRHYGEPDDTISLDELHI
jgi:hypothetical protein